MIKTDKLKNKGRAQQGMRGGNPRAFFAYIRTAGKAGAKQMGAFIAVLLLLFPMLVACTPQPESKPQVIRSYRDIPGVTDEEIRAIEEFRAQGSRFVYGMLHSSESYPKGDGQNGGFSALFCQWLTELFGIPFDLELYDLDELIAGLEAGRIHFTGELSPSAERLEKYQMSSAIAHRLVQCVRLRGAPDIEEIKKERLPRYGVLNNSATYGLAVSSEADNFTALFCDSYQEALELLVQGEADGLLLDNTAEALFMDHPDIVFQEFYPIVNKPKPLTTADERLSPMIRVIDRFLEADNGQFLLQLYDQGYSDYKRHVFSQSLTQQERAYIEERIAGGGIRVMYEYDNYPIGFYNETEEEYQGIAVDVLDAVSEITEIPLEVLQGDVAWAGVQERLERGEIDIVSELIMSDERTGRFVWPESTNMEDKFVLVSRDDSPHSSIGDVMNAQIGIIDATMSAQMFLAWFPEHEHVTVYPYNEAAFDALEAGEVDLLMVTQKMLLSYSNYKERPMFRASVVFDYVYESKFGLSKGNEMLASIIDKAARLIDVDTIANDWNLKVFNYQKRMYQMQIPYLTAFCVFLGCILVLAGVLLVRHRNANHRLEQTVQKRTRDLELRTQELEVQTQVAQAASKAKGEFLARMSHEIRTPLNAIIGMTQIARMSSEHSDTHRAQLDETLKASAHLLEVINQVLDMSKIESGKMAMRSEPFHLIKALDEVVSIFRQRCNEKKITFDTNYSELADVKVLGDRLHLKQILINLLGNAVKFTGECGEVRFLVDELLNSDEEIRIGFSIQDTGIGMTREQLSRLFNAFEQADSSISIRYGGSGLGLAISKYLVHEMGGKISVDSEYGVGSTFSFTLTLPKTDASVEQLPDTQGEELRLDLGKRRILLAEDIEINRVILGELLRDTHITIDEAVDGESVVQMFEKSPEGYYDLIFMDVQMPFMDGYEATGAIRALKRTDASRIPIIAMTANAYNEDIVRANSAGMNGHISKPIDIAVVKRTLLEYFPDALVEPQSPPE